MPSTITDEISFPSSVNFFSSASMSLKGRNMMLSVAFTGAARAGLSVAATASEVRP
jgi:hypothetical protein